MPTLDAVAPDFVTMAHRIVWCIAATVDADGAPRTRVLHPIWEWDGTDLTGWIATSPRSPKAAHLAQEPRLSLTYWATDHDTCTADCDTVWETDEASRAALWARFVAAPAPVGYDPSLIPGWDVPSSPDFGSLRLRPTRLRVMPGRVLLGGGGEVLAWHRGS